LVAIFEDKQAFVKLASLAAALVAGVTAWEGVANYREIWRLKYRASEMLYGEGWDVFDLVGKYKGKPDHRSAFSVFEPRANDIIMRETGDYVTLLVSEIPSQMAAALVRKLTQRYHQR
jgi:hypothetical protein